MFSGRKTRSISRKFVAMDFNSRRLHIVEGERVSHSLRVGRVLGVDIPESVDVRDAQAFGEFLRGVLKKMKLSGASLLMTVNRSDAVFKPLTLPPGTDPDEMAGMVQFQMQTDLPYTPAEAVIDFTVESHYDAEPTGPEDVAGVDLLVAAVKLPVVDRYRQIAHAAGAKLLRLGLRPYADRTCVESCIQHRSEEAVAIVHITADETEIDVTTGKGLTFSRPAVIKIPADPEALAEKADSLVSTVAVEVARSLRSYSAVEGQKRIDHVLVVGGTGIEQRVAEDLSDRLHLPAERLDPSETFRIRELEGARDASAFVTALGLAAGGRGDELPFDFLNPKQPVVKRDLRKVRIGALAILAALVVTLGLFYYQRNIIAPREAKVAELQRMLRRQKTYGEARDVEEQRVKRQEQFRKENADYLKHMAGVFAALPGAESLYIRQFRTEPDGLRFDVFATELDVIQTTLRENLIKAGYSVQLDSSERVEDRRDTRYGHHSEVTVAFGDRKPPDPEKLEPPERPADDISEKKGYQR